jgi:hypothetical protein
MASHYEQHFRWNDAQLAELKKRLEDGQSASEIGAFFGLSRNVIIGKVYRDGSLPRLQNKGRPKAESGPLKRVLQPVMRAALPQTISLPGGKLAASRGEFQSRAATDQSISARIATRKALATGAIAPPVVGYKPERFAEGFQGQVARVKSVKKLQAQHCRFPIDLAGGGLGFCGDTKEEHSSYCPAHAARCFNPQSAAMTRRVRTMV